MVIASTIDPVFDSLDGDAAEAFLFGGHVETEPEARLWQAVIIQALRDAFSTATPAGHRKSRTGTKAEKRAANVGIARDRQAAVLWLMGEDGRGDADFQHACTLAGIDAQALRQVVEDGTAEALMRDRRLSFDVRAGDHSCPTRGDSPWASSTIGQKVRNLPCPRRISTDSSLTDVDPFEEFEPDPDGDQIRADEVHSLEELEIVRAFDDRRRGRRRCCAPV